MDSDQIEKIEYFAFYSKFSIQDLGKKFSQGFMLPKMKYDYENDFEWLETEKDGIGYGISKAKNFEAQHLLNNNFPNEANYSVDIIYYKNEPICSEKTVVNFYNKLCDLFDAKVYHYRTWLNPGENKYYEIDISN